MSKAVRVGLVLAVVALAVLGLAMAGRLSRSRSVLEQYKAGLRAQGEKLTFEELVRGRPASTNHTLAVLTNAVAKLDTVPFAPGFLEIRKLTAPGRALVGWKQERPVLDGSRGGQGPGWEDLLAKVEAAKEPLAGLREALQNPPARTWECTNFLVAPIPGLAASRTAAQWLSVAAVCGLRQGQAEQALQDIEALAGLARMNREEFTLVHQMIRVAVANLGLSVSWEALQSPAWAEPQLSRLQRAWEAVDVFEGLELAVLGERAFGAALWSQARQAKGEHLLRTLNSGRPSTNPVLQAAFLKYVALPAYRATSINDDELFHLRQLQEMLGTVRSLKARRAWKEARKGWDAANAQVNQVARAAVLERLRYVLSLMVTPNFSKALESCAHAETERQMTLAAIAVRRFELRHGQLPPSLAALTPEFLSAASWDPMSGTALCYRLKAAGGFVLYSVGADGRDDGGDAGTSAKGPNAMWEGPDVVWPSADPPAP